MMQGSRVSAATMGTYLAALLLALVAFGSGTLTLASLHPVAGRQRQGFKSQDAIAASGRNQLDARELSSEAEDDGGIAALFLEIQAKADALLRLHSEGGEDEQAADDGGISADQRIRDSIEADILAGYLQGDVSKDLRDGSSASSPRFAASASSSETQVAAPPAKGRSSVAGRIAKAALLGTAAVGLKSLSVAIGGSKRPTGLGVQGGQQCFSCVYTLQRLQQVMTPHNHYKARYDTDSFKRPLGPPGRPAGELPFGKAGPPYWLLNKDGTVNTALAASMGLHVSVNATDGSYSGVPFIPIRSSYYSKLRQGATVPGLDGYGRGINPSDHHLMTAAEDLARRQGFLPKLKAHPQPHPQPDAAAHAAAGHADPHAAAAAAAHPADPAHAAAAAAPPAAPPAFRELRSGLFDAGSSSSASSAMPYPFTSLDASTLPSNGGAAVARAGAAPAMPARPQLYADDATTGNNVMTAQQVHMGGSGNRASASAAVGDALTSLSLGQQRLLQQLQARAAQQAPSQATVTSFLQLDEEALLAGDESDADGEGDIDIDIDMVADRVSPLLDLPEDTELPGFLNGEWWVATTSTSADSNEESVSNSPGATAALVAFLRDQAAASLHHEATISSPASIDADFAALSAYLRTLSREQLEAAAEAISISSASSEDEDGSEGLAWSGSTLVFDGAEEEGNEKEEEEADVVDSTTSGSAPSSFLEVASSSGKDDPAPPAADAAAPPAADAAAAAPAGDAAAAAPAAPADGAAASTPAGGDAAAAAPAAAGPAAPSAPAPDTAHEALSASQPGATVVRMAAPRAHAIRTAIKDKTKLKAPASPAAPAGDADGDEDAVPSGFSPFNGHDGMVPGLPNLDPEAILPIAKASAAFNVRMGAVPKKVRDAANKAAQTEAATSVTAAAGSDPAAAAATAAAASGAPPAADGNGKQHVWAKKPPKFKCAKPKHCTKEEKKQRTEYYRSYKAAVKQQMWDNAMRARAERKVHPRARGAKTAGVEEARSDDESRWTMEELIAYYSQHQLMGSLEREEEGHVYPTLRTSTPLDGPPLFHTPAVAADPVQPGIPDESGDGDGHESFVRSAGIYRDFPGEEAVFGPYPLGQPSEALRSHQVDAPYDEHTIPGAGGPDSADHATSTGFRPLPVLPVVVPGDDEGKAVGGSTVASKQGATGTLGMGLGNLPSMSLPRALLEVESSSSESESGNPIAAIAATAITAGASGAAGGDGLSVYERAEALAAGNTVKGGEWLGGGDVSTHGKQAMATEDVWWGNEQSSVVAPGYVPAHPFPAYPSPEAKPAGAAGGKGKGKASGGFGGLAGAASAAGAKGKGKAGASAEDDAPLAPLSFANSPTMSAYDMRAFATDAIEQAAMEAEMASGGSDMAALAAREAVLKGLYDPGGMLSLLTPKGAPKGYTGPSKKGLGKLSATLAAGANKVVEAKIKQQLQKALEQGQASGSPLNFYTQAMADAARRANAALYLTSSEQEAANLRYAEFIRNRDMLISSGISPLVASRMAASPQAQQYAQVAMAAMSGKGGFQGIKGSMALAKDKQAKAKAAKGKGAQEPEAPVKPASPYPPGVYARGEAPLGNKAVERIFAKEGLEGMPDPLIASQAISPGDMAVAERSGVNALSYYPDAEHLEDGVIQEQEKPVDPRLLPPKPTEQQYDPKTIVTLPTMDKQDEGALQAATEASEPMQDFASAEAPTDGVKPAPPAAPAAPAGAAPAAAAPAAAPADASASAAAPAAAPPAAEAAAAAPAPEAAVPAPEAAAAPPASFLELSSSSASSFASASSGRREESGSVVRRNRRLSEGEQGQEHFFPGLKNFAKGMAKGLATAAKGVAIGLGHGLLSRVGLGKVADAGLDAAGAAGAYPLPHACDPAKDPLCMQRLRQPSLSDFYRKLRRDEQRAAMNRALVAYSMALDEVCSSRDGAGLNAGERSGVTTQGGNTGLNRPAYPQPESASPGYPHLTSELHRRAGYFEDQWSYLKATTKYGDRVGVGSFKRYGMPDPFRSYCPVLRSKLALVVEKFLHGYDEEETCAALKACSPNEQVHTWSPGPPTATTANAVKAGVKFMKGNDGSLEMEKPVI